MLDDSASLPHLGGPLPPFTPFIRKASHVLLHFLPSPPPLPCEMKSPDVGDPSVVCITFLASSLFRAGRKRLIREEVHNEIRKHLIRPLSPHNMCNEGNEELAANLRCVSVSKACWSHADQNGEPDSSLTRIQASGRGEHRQGSKCSLFLSLKDFELLDSFRFTGKVRGGHRGFPATPSPHTRAAPFPLPTSPSGLMDLHRHTSNTAVLTSIVHTPVHTWWCSAPEFGQSMTTCIHHYSITRGTWAA